MEAFPICDSKKITNTLGSFQTTRESDLLRCVKIAISPSPKQRKILLKWFDAYRWMYNATIKYLREQDYNKVKKTLKFNKLRAIITSKYKKQIKHYTTSIGIPKHTLDNALKDVIKAYDSAFANLKNKNIKYFRLRYKKKRKPKQTICLEASCFSKVSNTFALRTLGKHITTSSPIDNISHDCRLSLEHGKMTLYKPEDSCKTTCIGRLDYVGLDPGVRTFQTCYDGFKTFDLGSEEPKKIKTLLYKIDAVSEFKKHRWYRKFIKRMYNKISHICDDLHWKSALYLTTHYNTILLGNMSTTGICRRDGNLAKMTKRICYSLSPYTFQMRLKAKAEQYGAEVHVIDEHYTSKTCGKCSHKHETLGANKVFKCPQTTCDFTWGRDQNGARNITLKHFELFKPKNM